MVVMSRERKVDFPFQSFLASDKTRKTVTYLISMSEIGSTEIALLVCGKNISATVLDDIINRMDSKDSLLHSESKGQKIDFMLLRS